MKRHIKVVAGPEDRASAERRHAYETAAQIAKRHGDQAADPIEKAVARSIEKEIRWAQGSRAPRGAGK